MLLISSFLLHSGGSALVHPCHEMPRSKKNKKQKCQNITIKPQFGEYLLTFPTTFSKSKRKRKLHIWSSNGFEQLLLPLAFKKIFVMGRFDLENFQARWSEKNPGSTPGKINIQHSTQKWRFGSGDLTCQFGDIFKQTSKYLFFSVPYHRDLPYDPPIPLLNLC